MRMNFPVSIKYFAGSTLLVLCALLTGCGMSGSVGNSAGSAAGSTAGSPTTGSPNVTIAVNGRVHGGQNPIYGGSIQLYQVGTTGYSSQALPLLATPVTTDVNGGFTITQSYTCTSGSYIYITSAGGSPQVSSNLTTNNNNITLAAALGLCDNLSSVTFVIINEVTTVAAAYSLAQFSQGTTFGQTMVNQPGSSSSAPADNFSTSSTNVAGLGNAMAISQVLASNATGNSPGSNTAGSISGVTGVTVSTGGSGYTSIPTVSFSAPASGVTATGLVGMSIGGVTITNPGTGYTTSCPTAIFEAPDESTISSTTSSSKAAGTPVCDIVGVTITAGGTGYATTPPTVTFPAPASGTTATGTANVTSGVVTSVTITNPGSGYTGTIAAPTFSGGSGSGATGTSVIDVTGVTITTAGVNYTSMPIVTFSNAQVGNTPPVNAAGVGTAGVVTTVNLTSGSGYTVAPTVTFSGGGATTQATGTATTGTVSDGNTAQPEWWQVNLIANMLAACVNSTGGVSGDGSHCGTLFANVLNGGTAPADTFQAALDLALYPTVPAANITNLYNLIPASGVPFQPYPSTAGAVTDFSIGIEYQPMAGSTTLLKQPSTVSIDSLGNAWVANQPTVVSPTQGYLVELTPTGVPIQAGSAGSDYLSNFAINSYSLGGVYTDMGGQYGYHGTSPVSSPPYGLFAPAIDTNNNLWINDRMNGAMVNITGSGTTYSNGLNYQNGGNALDAGGKGATGVSLPQYSSPVQTYIDGSNNVWFNMTGEAEGHSAITSVTCTTLSLTGTINLGLGVFVGESTTNVKAGSTYNYVGVNDPYPFIVIDPNLSDYTTVSGTQTPIPGAPFVWEIGGNASSATALMLNYSQQSGAANTQACDPVAAAPNNIGPAGLALGANTLLPAITNPNLAGDTLNAMATINDVTFDKYGNLWLANQGQIDTQTTTATAEIKSAISKVTPNYGNAFTIAQAESGFTFNVFHQVASLYDGITTYYPQYLTSDGGGNIWFAMSSAGSKYVNAISNTGTALSPYTVETPGTGNATGGFAGSVCTNCTFNGTTATFQRPNTWALGRPAVDLSGNVWIPVNGQTSASSFSTYVDVLVGIATPKVNPDSLGLKNSTFASKP